MVPIFIQVYQVCDVQGTDLRKAIQHFGVEKLGTVGGEERVGVVALAALEGITE